MSLFSDQIQWYHVQALEKMGMSLSTIWTVEQWEKGNKVENKETKKLRNLMWIKDDVLTSIATDTYYGLMNMAEPQVNKKRGVREKPTGLHAEQWNEFWEQWPQMRTVKELGAAGICEKEFKSNEDKLRAKYNSIIEAEGLTPEQINYAAKVYLATGLVESIRKGRNEVQYLSGMAPWLNQFKYRIWKDIAMPKVNSDVEEYVNYGG